MAALAERDSLNQRVRDVLLFDNYGPEALGVSRQGVHDLVARAREHMEEYEASFGLAALRRRLETMERELEENKSRLPEDFYINFKKLLEG